MLLTEGSSARISTNDVINASTWKQEWTDAQINGDGIKGEIQSYKVELFFPTYQDVYSSV